MTQKEYISQLLNINIPYETTVGEYVRTLEQRIAELEYNYSCVLDNATGGRASKTNIDLNTAYKLIADNTNFWVESAIEELEAPKTCKGCIHFTPSSTQHFELCTYDFDCSDDYKPPSRFEPKERSNDNTRRI